MRLVVASAIIAFAAPAAAQSLDVPSGTYTIDPAHASVVWKVSHFGLSNYTGMVERGAIDATITLDAENVANSSVQATVDGTRIATLHPGEKDFNQEIASDQFLNAVEFPDLTFVSNSIEVTGENTANITGDLTIRGTTIPVVMETTLNAAMNHPMSGEPALGISAEATIDRTEFGVTSLAGPVGEMVTLLIEAEFQRSE